VKNPRQTFQVIGVQLEWKVSRAGPGNAMGALRQDLFLDSASIRVGEVTISAGDDLQTTREKLARVVLDEMYQFVGLLDANGNTLEVNRSALDGAGIHLDEIQGKPFWETRWWAVSQETSELQRQLVARAAGGEVIRCDVDIFGEDAGEHTITIDFSLLPVRDDAGKILFLLAEGRNITEKKRAEAELQRLLHTVQQLDQLKSDFFANVSHELRTPLTLILGPVESMLQAEEDLTELQRRDLGVIQRNASTLLKHVNDLLDVSKLDAGRHTANYMRVDVAREVRTLAAHFDALAPQRSISYVVMAPEVFQAEVDPEKLARILLNLLSNAFKYTPEGGRIQCDLQPDGHDRFLICVQDTGPGIQPEMRAAVFERFRQAQSGTTREFGGTGLGLAIVKEFVDLHGGTVTIGEAAGGGARFEVGLPRWAPPGASVKPEEATGGATNNEFARTAARGAVQVEVPANAGPLDRPIILVAEDNLEMRRYIVEALGERWRVVSTADGAEALRTAMAEPPDVVVTDLMMPKLGGDRLVAEMRCRESLADIPVLVLSAKADDSLRVKLLSTSVQDYIVKPFSRHELRARVRNLVEMKRTRDTLGQDLTSKNEDLTRLTQQLQAASIIQQGIMAVKIPELTFATIQGRNIACTQIGGDFFNVTAIPDGVVVTIADVSGKGIPAAVMAALLQGMIHEDVLSGVPLPEIARRANQFFCVREVASKYATFVIVSVHSGGEVEYLNCAHIPPIIAYNNALNGRRAVRLSETNLPVGLLPDSKYESATLRLRPSDRLILVTDGVTEAQSPAGEFFGDERLQQCALAERALEEILGSVHCFCEDRPLDDDCTVVEVTYLGLTGAPARSCRSVDGVALNL
jgi:PAS domain S-box-containing protein